MSQIFNLFTVHGHQEKGAESKVRDGRSNGQTSDGERWRHWVGKSTGRGSGQLFQDFEGHQGWDRLLREVPRQRLQELDPPLSRVADGVPGADGQSLGRVLAGSQEQPLLNTVEI